MLKWDHKTFYTCYNPEKKYFAMKKSRTKASTYMPKVKENKKIIYKNREKKADMSRSVYQKFCGLRLAAEITTTKPKSAPGPSTSFPLVQ
jgi:hypothetical protein